jgi:hypothetical protein
MAVMRTSLYENNVSEARPVDNRLGLYSAYSYHLAFVFTTHNSSSSFTKIAAHLFVVQAAICF